MKNSTRMYIKLPAILCIALLTFFMAACSTTTGNADASSTTASSTPKASTSTPVTNKNTGSSSSSSSSSTTSQTGSSSNTSSGPKRPVTTTKIIRMVNQVGWALTKNAIIRTTDSGHIWHDVTPNITLGPDATGDFIDELNAWVAYTNTGTNAVFIEHTSDGGQTWQQYSTNEPTPQVIDQPHFLNSQEGWLEVAIDGGPGAGQEKVDVLHSLDGGQTWQHVSNPPDGGMKDGISFKDSQNGWATGNDVSNAPWVYVTHNGGQSWQSVSLPDLPGAGSSSVFYRTTPPVFFGNFGELPVYVNNAGTQNGMLLYKTNDGGYTWTTDYKNNHAALDQGYPEDLYILNQHYAWTDDAQDGTIRMTDSAGLVWINQGNVSLLQGLSFIDPSNGFALGQTQLYRTNDGGQHWYIQQSVVVTP